MWYNRPSSPHNRFYWIKWHQFHFLFQLNRFFQFFQKHFHLHWKSNTNRRFPLNRYNLKWNLNSKTFKNQILSNLLNSLFNSLKVSKTSMETYFQLKQNSRDYTLLRSLHTCIGAVPLYHRVKGTCLSKISYFLYLKWINYILSLKFHSTTKKRILRTSRQHRCLLRLQTWLRSGYVIVFNILDYCSHY